jgi:hypothetical protein
MKNIHLLPTDKPSRLLKTIPKGNLILSKLITSGSHWENQNIYIISDENTKVGEWALNMDIKILVKSPHAMYNNAYFKKIILTTDQDLINDGVQDIDDEFLEWFVNNPTCEEVKTRKIGEEWIYNADVPKEEPKQEKDLSYWKANAEEDYIKVPISVLRYITELEKRMYSEEEVYELLLKHQSAYRSAVRNTSPLDWSFDIKQWFEQFKKK